MKEKPGGGPKEWGGGVELSTDDSTRHGEGGGVESPQDDSTPNGRGGGVESWPDDSTKNENVGEIELSQDDLNPKEDGGPRGYATLEDLTASQSRRGEDGRVQGGGDENPPTNQATREQPPDGRDGLARRGDTETPAAAMEMPKGAGGTGHLPKHSTDAAAATTENGMHLRSEYDKVAL